MIKILFSDRVKIQRLFEAWCVKNQAEASIHNLVAFLEHRGWLNVDRVMKDLKG